jgi:hypothetical protein
MLLYKRRVVSTPKNTDIEEAPLLEDSKGRRGSGNKLKGLKSVRSKTAIDVNNKITHYNKEIY